MGLKINLLEEVPAIPGGFKATTRLWLNADRTKLVPEGDEECAFLFCGVGETVSKTDAEKYGLLKPKAEKQAEAPADKQAAKPADKQRKKGEDKAK